MKDIDTSKMDRKSGRRDAGSKENVLSAGRKQGPTHNRSSVNGK